MVLFPVGHQWALHQPEPSQPLDVILALKAGHHEPQRVALVRTHRLPVLAVRDDHVVQGLAHREARAEPDRFGPFREDPVRPRFHAHLVEQRGERHAGPLAARDHPVHLLDGLSLGGRPVDDALDVVGARDGRQAHEIVHREHQRPLHQAGDHESMLAGIDVRGDAAVGGHVVQVGRGDVAYQVPQRRERIEPLRFAVQEDVLADVRYHRAHDGHVTRAFAEGHGVRRESCGRRRSGNVGVRGPRAHGHTGQGGTRFQETSSGGLLRIHDNLSFIRRASSMALVVRSVRRGDWNPYTTMPRPPGHISSGDYDGNTWRQPPASSG